MAYVTVTDLEHRLGNKAMVQLTNHDIHNATTINTTVAQEAIDDAQGLIDSYIGQRVTLPIDKPSAFVKTLTKDLAIYYLRNPKGATNSKENATKKLYDDAITHLERFAAGKTSLGLAIPKSTIDTDKPSDQAEITSEPRQNTRTKLGRLT